MSASCVGTCSACGIRRLWPSDTLALQLDDGSLTCLCHPAEECDCERLGLTLGQASERGRLYRETFYVCRRCGRTGAIIERENCCDCSTESVWGPTRVAILAVLAIGPLLFWLRWWNALILVVIVVPLVPASLALDRLNRRRALAKQGLPRADAPGRSAVGAPARGTDADAVVGRRTGGTNLDPTASGGCCERPDWVPAFSVKDEDRVPCCACGRGVMIVSEHAIH